MGINQIEQKLRELTDPQQAAQLQPFFKTDSAGYGQGHRFPGIRVPRLA